MAGPRKQHSKAIGSQLDHPKIVQEMSMSANSSEDSNSSSVLTKDKPRKVLNSDVVKLQSESLNKQRQRLKHKHQGDYNTFVVPEILCQCQQKCTDRVTPSLIQKISMYFFGLRENKEMQKSYLASLILGREKQIDMKAMQGKRIRKMSYRYFVPIVTDKDLKDQSEENAMIMNKFSLQNNKIKKHSGKITINPVFREKNWDHVEVCLKAFTSVHIISEKKVIVTRSVCQLNPTIRCSRPFQKDHSHCMQQQLQDTNTNKSTSGLEAETPSAGASSEDVGAATAAWLMEYCQNNPTFPVNPKTFLPEGLILPDSMICVPIFSGGDYVPSDPDRDVDIVDNFFFNQLWKPEYISDSGSNNNNKNV